MFPSSCAKDTKLIAKIRKQRSAFFFINAFLKIQQAFKCKKNQTKKEHQNDALLKHCKSDYRLMILIVRIPKELFILKK